MEKNLYFRIVAVSHAIKCTEQYLFCNLYKFIKVRAIALGPFCEEIHFVIDCTCEHFLSYFCCGVVLTNRPSHCS